MVLVDANGKWEINGNVKILIEPSEEYIEANKLTPERIKLNRISEIKQELERLDKDISRVMEDVIMQGGFDVHESKMAVINRKIQLRQELIGLEV